MRGAVKLSLSMCLGIALRCIRPPRPGLGRGSWDQLHVCKKDLTKSLLNEAFQASPGRESFL